MQTGNMTKKRVIKRISNIHLSQYRYSASLCFISLQFEYFWFTFGLFRAIFVFSGILLTKQVMEIVSFLPAEAFCGVLAWVLYSRPVEPTGSGPWWDSNQMSQKQLTKQTPCSAAPGLCLSLGFLGPFTNSLKRRGCWSVSVFGTYPPRL